mgnify:CR=1 FL=1
MALHRSCHPFCCVGGGLRAPLSYLGLRADQTVAFLAALRGCCCETLVLVSYSAGYVLSPYGFIYKVGQSPFL